MKQWSDEKELAYQRWKMLDESPEDLLFDPAAVADINFKLEMIEEWMASLRYWLFLRADEALPAILSHRQQDKGAVALDYIRSFAGRIDQNARKFRKLVKRFR